MKNKIWIFQLPIVALFTWCFWVVDSGMHGQLQNDWIRSRVFPNLRAVHGQFTNLKFLLRGPEVPKSKVILVEIDEDAVSHPDWGRWPWSRDKTAALTHSVFKSGAKTVGFDIFFPEPDERVTPAVREAMLKAGLKAEYEAVDTDAVLEVVTQQYKDHLVLGWSVLNSCQKAYDKGDACDALSALSGRNFPQSFLKLQDLATDKPKNLLSEHSTIQIAKEIASNIERFSQHAKYHGHVHAHPDADGVIRWNNLVFRIDEQLWPTIGLAMAQTHTGKLAQAKVNERGQLDGIKFGEYDIPVSPSGVMDINFRGPSYTYLYVRALQALSEDDVIPVQYKPILASSPHFSFLANPLPEPGAEPSRAPASDGTAAQGHPWTDRVGWFKRTDIFKDAAVIIGLSAKGAFDMRSFPFDSNTPGMEGHATILDNLLAGDAIVHAASGGTSIILYVLMIVLASVMAYSAQKLESIPALALFIVALGGVAAVDVGFLFAKHNINFTTGFLYLELAAVFVFTIAVKYVIEENNKKFLKDAFSRYVATSIVDSIIKDPKKLQVGGEKKDITILFSDIRGFTTFSEKMDAKRLTQFLNDYLGIMTDIVFEYNGTLDKYIGDAVMAFWGAPVDVPKHASQCAKAAVAMQRALSKNRERYKRDYGIDVDIGIGLNTGSVSVGNMGSNRIFEYTVIGDHVNLASRIEGLTKYYGAAIITSSFAIDQMKESGETPPDHRVLDLVKVKGKKTAVELIEIFDEPRAAAAIQSFNEARQLYAQQKWDMAIDGFKTANEAIKAQMKKDDPASIMYIERCTELKASPPAPDWDGSWEMTSK